MKSVYKKVIENFIDDIRHLDLTLILIYINLVNNKIKSAIFCRRDLSTEIFYWERVYHNKYFGRNVRKKSLACNKYIRCIIENLKRDTSGQLRFIDVGCGPRSELYSEDILNDSGIEVITVDPLSSIYNRLNKKYNIDYKIKCIEGDGEKLDQLFNKNSFHLVVSQNAIDHSYSPDEFLNKLYYILKPNGYLLLKGYIKVGTAENWIGLHQWDIEVIDNDMHLTSKNNSTKVNMTEKFKMQPVYSKVAGQNPGAEYVIIYKK